MIVFIINLVYIIIFISTARAYIALVINMYNFNAVPIRCMKLLNVEFERFYTCAITLQYLCLHYTFLRPQINTESVCARTNSAVD